MIRLLASLALVALLGTATLSADDAGHRPRGLGHDSTDIADGRSLSPVGKLKEALLMMMRDLNDVTEEIESVEDVRNARPAIAATMGTIVRLTEEMIAATLTPEDGAALRTLQTDLQADPRFTELNEQGMKAQAALAERSLEAAAELEKVIQEEGMKMAQAMVAVMEAMKGGAAESSDVEGMIVLQRRLNDLIDGIETLEDVTAADAEIGVIFDKTAAAIMANLYDPNDPEMLALENDMVRALEELAERNPEAGVALSNMLMKHSDRMSESADDMMNRKE